MAVPRLATQEPFYRLDPTRLDPGADFRTMATGQGAADLVPRVGLHEMDHIDLVVCGSVAVDHTGARIGKGGGYSDIEVGSWWTPVWSALRPRSSPRCMTFRSSRSPYPRARTTST
jgi:5-formyltetrahydrofolate cyclo-ligase